MIHDILDRDVSWFFPIAGHMNIHIVKPTWTRINYTINHVTVDENAASIISIHAFDLIDLNFVIIEMIRDERFSVQWSISSDIDSISS